MADVQKLVEDLSALTIADAVALKEALEEKWGVQAASMAVAAAPVAGAAAVEEKTEFTVVLVAHGAKKIEAIKAIREVLTLGLKEAKDFVEAAPKTVKEDVSKDEAEEVKKKLEAAGCKVEVK